MRIQGVRSMAMERDRVSRRSILRRSLHALSVRPRLIAATALGILVGLLLPRDFTGQSRLLIGWDAGVALYLASTWTMMIRSDVHQLRRRAAQHDEGEWTIILLSMAADVVEPRRHRRRTPAGRRRRSLPLLAGGSCRPHHRDELAVRPHDHGPALCPRLLSARGLSQGEAGPDLPRSHRGTRLLGTSPISPSPSASAAQTADVAIASPRIRRVALAHSVLAFVLQHRHPGPGDQRRRQPVVGADALLSLNGDGEGTSDQYCAVGAGRLSVHSGGAPTLPATTPASPGARPNASAGRILGLASEPGLHPLTRRQREGPVPRVPCRAPAAAQTRC